MTSRILDCFTNTRRRGRGAFIAYLTAGYPSMQATVDMARALDGVGVDVLELGVPFSDPVADGPVIQRASDAALRAGVTLAGVLDAAATITSTTNLPVVLFSYYNPLLQYGLERLARHAAEARIDGVLVTDMIAEESMALLEATRPAGLDTVFLVAPTTTDTRLARICELASGFVYAIARTGVTGAGSDLSLGVEAMVSRIRAHTALPVALGFGISTADQVARAWQVADGAVVGSRLVVEIERNPVPAGLAERVAACAASLIPVG